MVKFLLTSITYFHDNTQRPSKPPFTYPPPIPKKYYTILKCLEIKIEDPAQQNINSLFFLFKSQGGRLRLSRGVIFRLTFRDGDAKSRKGWLSGRRAALSLKKVRGTLVAGLSRLGIPHWPLLFYKKRLFLKRKRLTRRQVEIWKMLKYLRALLGGVTGITPPNRDK